MVAIVTGNGLGWQSSSALGLGTRGQLGEASVGQTGEQVYVNAANGNLSVQDRDLMLIGRGIDSRIHRAYNSQGKLAADGWRPGSVRTVGAPSGKLNEAGSTVTRTDWDGSTVIYGYDTQRRLYVATSGAGARATLAYDAGMRQWTWWDGGKLLSEIYDATRGGRLFSASDRDGNKVVYTYDGAGLLSRVTTAGGESTYLDYTAGRLARLRTVWIGENGAQRTSTAVHYGYDVVGRLSTVTVDLTPDDNSIADGKVFTTTYRYDGTSERVASIAQSDGAEVAFTYTLLGGEYRVTSIAQRADGGVARVTRLAYDLDARRTTITDMLGAATVLAYDDAGRLVETVPPAGGTQRFHYDAAGNVVKVDEAGGGVEYRYDARGNRLWQRDAAGSVVEWRYGENDELLEQITRLGGGESAITTYVYDARRHLRFVVDAERRATEYLYNGLGQQVSVLAYAGAGYAGAGFGEADLTRWVAGLADKSAGTRTDTAYDFRGNVASVTRYGRLLKDGTGDVRAGAGEVTQTRYVYDPSGRLLQRFVGAPGKQQVEQFAYDGLGRMLSARRFDGTTTLYRYDDARHQTIVTFSNDLTRTSTFNGAGELVAVTESAADVLLSQVGYTYDAAGRLRMETDALGQRTHYLYDPAGRKIAQIDAAGGLSEYVYTPAGQVARTIRYAMPLSAEQLAGLADTGGLDGMAALKRVRPAAQASDQSEWRAYDGAGRLARSVTGDGALTTYRYDVAGRLLQTVQYAKRAGISGSDPSSEPLPSASAADRSTRYFYDGAGLLRGQLDAEGYLTEYQYDMAGRRIATIRYATAVTEVDRVSTSVADFRPAESSNDIRMQASYDARGLLRTEIDGEGHATVYEYDEFGNVAQRVRTERVDQGVARAPQTVRLTFDAKLERPKLTGAALTIRVDGKDVGKVEVMSTTARRYALDIANLVPADDHRVEFIFGSFMDEATVQNAMFGQRPFAQPGARPNGRPSGMLEKSQNYLLDGAGTEKSWIATSTKQERTAYRYDAMGRLLERTTSAMLGSTATRYTYDSEGRVTSETTGDRALHYRYDVQGRLIAQLSGEGAAALAALAGKPTAAQVDAVWRSWGEHYTYDAAGRRTSSTDANGSRTTFYYDAAGRVTHQVNALGEVAEQRYDALGNLTQTLAYAKRMGRDASGELAGGVLTDAVRRAVAALGNERTSRATFAYDHAGRVVRSVDAMASATWRAYDVFGNEIATRQDLSAGVRSTRMTDYDRLGRAVRTAVDPGGLNLVTRASYDAFGREIETTDASGVVRRREYDRNGNTIVVTDGLGQQSRMTYDAFGNVLTRTDRAGATTRYAYVPDKRQLTVSMPDGILTTTTYDEFGQTVALTDGRGQTTRYAYDRAGRLTGTTTPTGVTRQHYDRVGQLIETVDGRGVRTTYAYDAAGRVLTRTLDPGGLNLTTRYEYDAKGQLVRSTEPSGTVIVTEYDLNGRKVAVVTDAGDGRLNLRTTFEYDGAGKVLATTDGTGTPGTRTTRYEYDGASRLTRTVVDPDGLALATCYDYDSNGNVKRVVDAAGGVTRYGYDAENRRICEVGPTGAVVLSRVDAEGRVIARTAYAIPNAGLLDDAVGPLSSSDLAERIAASPDRDRTVRHVHDVNGRVRYTLDTLGALTEFRYDENGNAVFAAEHGRVLDATQPLTEASITAQLRRFGLGHDRDASRVTRTVYDAANRAVFVVDPLGYVTQSRYDTAGNLLERINFPLGNWTVMAGFTELSERNLLEWAQSLLSFASTRVTSWRYDNAGRVTENIDAEGYLTRNEYDGVLLRRTIRYGEVVDGKRSLPVGVIEKLLPAKPAVATTAVTEYRHDGAGRVTDVVDAAGIATHYGLDALGRAVETIRAKGSDRQVSTRTTFDAAGRMIREVQASGTSAAAAVDYRYDALGNLAVCIDPRGVELAETDSDWALAQRKALGYVDAQGRALAAAALTAAQREELAGRYATRYRYDAAGRLTDETDPLGHADRTTYDAFGDAVERVTKGVSAKLFYDGLGRVVAQVNPDGAVIQTQYSASGQPIRVARFAKGMLDWGTVAANGDASAVLSRLQGQPEAVTHLEYDKLDRLVKSTDAEGGIETYGYNGFGDRIVYQNKVGAVFKYDYDNRGLLISETLPVTSKGSPVRNFHLYDAGGRRTVTIEAAELPEQRTTRFEYDALGRLVSQTGDAVAVRTASGDTRTVDPVETRAYDARGNLVRQTDANGNTTTWYYDAANRKTAEMSATGTLTQWTYDTAGNRIVSRVFADPVAQTAGAEPPAPVHADRVRETRYRYDENNRLIESRVLNVATGYFDPSAGETQRGEYFITTGSELVTRYRYDGAGRVIEQTDPAGNRTLSFYDRMGNKMLEIDGAGYGIHWVRDAEGRVLTETRFAARYPDPIAPNPAMGDTLAAKWPASADDRITRYTWDGNGRLISETRQGVQHAAVDANGRLEERVADATTRYVYDGEGHLLRKTDANGSQFDFTYDALGRQTSQMLPQFVDHLNRQVRSRISFEYDGLNQVVKETKHGDADQVTTYAYGAGGRMASKTNALGVVTQFGYDAAGNTVLVSFLRADADGRKQLDETGIGYDAANRETSRITRSRNSGGGAVLAGGVLREQRYNAFGEVVGRRTGGGGPNGEWQEYADYNNAGWVVRSNFGDGVSRLFLHDRNGNASLKVESMETDLRGHAIETGDDLVGLLKRADMMQTYTRYDARNQVIQVRQPKTSGGAPRVSFSPVDIPIDGGRFANTQLTIGGHSDRPSRPVTGPVLPPGAAGQLVGDAGVATGEMVAQVTVTAQLKPAIGELWIDDWFDVVLPPALEEIYGPYDIQVDVLRNTDYDGVVGWPYYSMYTDTFSSGRLPGSPKSIRMFLRGNGSQVGKNHMGGHGDYYFYQIYLFPFNGAGEKIPLLGNGRVRAPLNEWVDNESLLKDLGWVGRSYSGQASEGNNAISVAGNTLTVAKFGVSSATESMLYVRQKGQDVAFRAIARSASSAPDAYAIDLAALPDGDYEMIYMAVSNGSDGRPAGTLLRREGYLAHISRAGGSSIVYDAVPADAPTTRAGLVVDGGGNYVWASPQQLNMYALRSSAGQLADYVTVRVRGSGERNWREPVLLRRDAASGAFQLDLSGYPPGDYQVQIDLHGQQGMLDSMRGSIALRGAGSSPEMSIAYVGSYSSTIVFRAQPPETDHLMVSWEQDGQTRYSKISRLGNGEFTWDATADGLIPDGGLIYSYSIKFTTYDAYGRPLSMGKGDITVGHEGFREVTLEGSDLPCIFEFSPQDDHGRKLENAATLVLYYRAAPHAQTDYDKPFSEAILTRDGAGRFLFDATSLPTNTEYEYRYIAKDAQGNVLTERQSYFLTGTRNNPVTNVDIVGVIDETAKDMTIDRMQSHNAFGEVSAERDGRGNWTYSSFNTMGRLTLKREPEIGITLADGTKVRVAPETRFHYDLTGNLVGMKDANGNLSTHQWNYGLAQPAVARSWDALGHDKRFAYDAQGNLRVQYDELNRRTDFTYDAGDRLIRVDRPVLANGANAGRRSVDRYEYDAAGNRIAHIDALGGRERTYYDSEGRVIRTVSAAGRSMQYDYRWASTIGTVGGGASGGWVKTTADANGRTMIDESDLFGRLMKHTDLGGRVFDYTYNRAGLLTHQHGTSGQDVGYEYYSHGLVRAIRDRGTQTESLYEYDGDGNRTAEFFRSIGARYLFAQSTVEYDAANRVTAIRDDAYQVRYEYDAVGNRRRMTADYTDLVGYHKKTQDYWYEYDALNRFTVTMGVLSDGRIVGGPKGGDGVQLGYNAAGERVLAVYASDGRTERYEYDANGYLTNQSINGVVVRERESDLLGRVTGYTEYTADRSKRTEQVTRYYDADGLQLSERDVLEGATTRYTRMSDGTLERTERRPDKGNGTAVTTAYTYEWWDGAKQKTAVSQGTNPNAPGWKPASSYYNYDVNGNLKSVYDDGGGQKGKARAFSYWTDLRGQVQRRDELVGVSISADGTITGSQGDRKHNYYYLNGHRVGNVGNDGVEKVDYVQELAGKLGKGKESQYRVTTPVSVADFDENYLRIDGTYPGASPGTWTVREGETLKSIASALWGDETLWYVLADANGLKSTDELKAGQTLTVPNKVTNVHNTASTFKPYDPGQAIGDTQPTLPDPPPPPSRGGGCGGFLPVIAIVVAVVATVMTAGVAASVIAPTATAGMSTFAAGAGALTGTLGAAGASAAAIGGAVGAVAAQGVMIAGGAQSGLDWKGVALGAVGAGVTAGTGSALGLANSTASAVVQGAARSVVTQGIGVATGLQHSFDWKGVAASAIASGVGFGAGRAIGSSVSGMDPTVGRLITGVGAGMAAGAASTVVRGGSLGRNVGAITMDAMASTVGNMVVNNVQVASVDSTTRRTQDAIAAVNGQILPGRLGGVGSGFVAPESTYSNAALPYGAYGGLVDTTPTTYSSASTLYGPSMGVPAAPTQLAGQAFSAQFPDALPGIQVADASDLFGRLAQNSSARTDAMMSAYQLPRLDPLAGQPKLAPMDGAVSRASSDATFMRFMETQYTQPIGGLMANAAIQATGNTGYAVAVADAAGPLDALWAPAGGRFNSVSSVRRGQPALESVGPSATLARIESRFGTSSREVGFIVDSASGNILTVARQPYGQSSASFKFGPEQWALAEGNWITHNHPSGLTLGIEDLAGAVASGARGIRASTAVGTYELIFDRSFGAAYRSDYAGAYGFLHAQTNEIGRGIMADIRSGAMAVPQELQGAQRRGFLADEMWVRFSSQMPNLKYNFYPR
ncbi:LysM peptidoglycan-binding domain-containing protein [Burkholderia stagnalis]|uniref:LysM peptidoglycan-binding domain-containing protein n=1 Tax=Burkholderia stagnalis TaxID=1503054 RepID=UPI0009BD50D1|nr:LysM peptidoglycan-binding domain-containing protein [Burkholderia stagnalis]